jgi:hypothetical protein
MNYLVTIPCVGFFGLAPYVKPSKNTLDTLARFNGYKDYVHYLKINPYEAYWSDKEKLYGLLNEDSEEIIKFINKTNFKNEQALDFIISLCRELIYLNKVGVLDLLFRKLERKYIGLFNIQHSKRYFALGIAMKILLPFFAQDWKE